MIGVEWQIKFHDGSVSPADMEKFRDSWSGAISGSTTGYFTRFIVIHDLDDYPWIKSLDHLKRVNRYRRRVGQTPLNFNDEHIAELALTSKT